MARAPRTEEIKVRVTADMKAKVLELADQRGESESVIVREALSTYISRLDARAKGLESLLGPITPGFSVNEPPADYGAPGSKNETRR